MNVPDNWPDLCAIFDCLPFNKGSTPVSTEVDPDYSVESSRLRTQSSFQDSGIAYTSNNNYDDGEDDVDEWSTPFTTCIVADRGTPSLPITSTPIDGKKRVGKMRDVQQCAIQNVFFIMWNYVFNIVIFIFYLKWN